MREILFRGKRVDNGEWVTGDGIHYPKSVNYKGTCWIDGMHEKANDWFRVIPESVGQYTGLKDKNGVRIFEGDIFRCKSVRGYVRFGTYASACSSGDTHVGFFIEWISDGMLRIDLAFWANQREIEVIGNIHNNPELMKG